ncbi:putative PGG domain-containing protein [Helianthus annuus]|nr:putative PGG domain-containing protein [Helianthus annuus]
MEDDQILMTIAKTFPTDLGFTESSIYPSLDNVRQRIVVRDVIRVAKSFKNTCCSWLGNFFMILLVPTIATLYPIYALFCLLVLVLRFPFSMFYFLLWKVLEIITSPIKNIEKKKKEYKEAKKILSLICDQMGASRSSYYQPILEAVRQDAYQVVDEILYWAPDTINCKDEEGHNVIQLAIINRSEKVYNLIRHIVERIEPYRTIKDSSMNNLVHLAGKLAPSFVLGRTTGAALQLQRELQWHEEVKSLMLPLEHQQKNMYMETPAMVFEREHADLMKQGENWTKTTAESCSITAALIVTVVFAAAITVPGGSNQESGIPLLKKQIAFTIFAVTNAFSLFTAATALLLFLSILTTRFSEKDFLVSLPRRLIFGLFTLFLSTTSMVVAFGAISYLVFCDHRPYMLAPIVLFACFPILVIVSIKLPLMVALFWSTYFPIFGRPSYIDRCKNNRKNTIFFGEGINTHLEGRLLSF